MFESLPWNPTGQPTSSSLRFQMSFLRPSKPCAYLQVLRQCVHLVDIQYYFFYDSDHHFTTPQPAMSSCSFVLRLNGNNSLCIPVRHRKFEGWDIHPAALISGLLKDWLEYYYYASGSMFMFHLDPCIAAAVYSSPVYHEEPEDMSCPVWFGPCDVSIFKGVLSMCTPGPPSESLSLPIALYFVFFYGIIETLEIEIRTDSGIEVERIACGWSTFRRPFSNSCQWCMAP